MNAEIPQHQIVDRLERRAGDPTVIPADRHMRADDLADEPRGDGLAQIGQMRRPAPVLVDGELDTALLGLLDQRLAGREVLDERLLRQDMLAGGEGAPHQVDPNVRMGRNVENCDAGIVEHLVEIVRRVGVRKEIVAPRPRALQNHASRSRATFNP